MGAFPNLSRNVPFCPRLSSFVPICPRSGPQEGQKRTNGDKTGHFGTNWERPPFSIYPHLALLNSSLDSLAAWNACAGIGSTTAAGLVGRRPLEGPATANAARSAEPAAPSVGNRRLGMMLHIPSESP